MQIEHNSRSGYKWVMLVLMCLGIMAPQYSQFMMTHWGTPWLQEIGITDKSKFVNLMNAPLIPGALLSLVSGVLVDRFGLKRILMIAYSVAVAAIVARRWATTYELMFICMLLSGVAATFFNANQMKIVGRWFPERQSVMALGIFVAFCNGSMAIGLGISTLFANYRDCFISAAIFAILMWVAWLVLGKEKPSVPVGDVDEKTPPILECLKVTVKSKSLWIITIGMMLFQSSALTLSQYLMDALKDSGYETGLAATVTNVFTVSAMVGCLIMPRLIRRAARPKLIFAIIGVLSAAGVAFAWQIPALPLKIAALAALGFVTLGCTPVLTSAPMSLPEIGPKYAGTAGGFMATLMLAFNVVIPGFVTMPLARNDYRIFYMLEGCIMLIFVFMTPFLPIKGKAKKVS
ncbi:MAG: MFS transporter [Oscillospiraceae bacterium]|jgi:NNP family nitrate/nitrite transporter-like MFS transporter|nr:MFS transporter [Oscillospiraceae bacterium]